jgi:hypothetical protein
MISSLGNLKSVGGSLNIKDTGILDFGELEFVGGDIYLSNTPLAYRIDLDELAKKIDIRGRVLTNKHFNYIYT